MNVCIIDYGMGNIASVANAVSSLGHKPELVSDPDLVGKSDFIILPGVGAFPEAMMRLKNNHLDTSILEEVTKGKPILGICLGMQLLFSKSYEFGESTGLDIIKGEVLSFKKKTSLRIPHMGWNNVYTDKTEFKSFIGDYYFVHSFYCQPEDGANILFTTNYGIEFCSAINKANQIYGLQFHPEKSQKMGLSLLDKILS